MEQTIKQFYPLITDLIKLPQKKVWTDYDEEADVLYVSFGQPQRANDTVPTEQGILLRKKAGKVIGFTILNASRFLKDN